MKINRIILIVFLISVMMIFLTTFISAYQVGQNVTQAQLDNVNVSNLNIQDLECQSEGYRYESRRNAFIIWSCLDIIEYPGTDHYVIVRTQQSTRINPIAIRGCVQREGLDFCRTLMRNKMKERVFNNFENLKRKIKDFQTDTELDNWVNDLLGNFDPFR